ncbi:MAG: glutathione peroxidase [Desulfobulbaceae bacterium]|nr:MAG: glutathione peroxidase [Desulfobulbaceae bacterium]
MASIYDFAVTTIDGRQTTLAEYRGKVLLIVNVASRCGFTPQYDGLEKLHLQYGDQGLVVLGFPCNQFGNQEPGTETEIIEFCRLNYGVSFPMFAKIAVNGPEAHPLYAFLKTERPGILGSTAIKWNFTKFLVDRSGRVTARFPPTTTPESLEREIRRLL